MLERRLRQRCAVAIAAAAVLLVGGCARGEGSADQAPRQPVESPTQVEMKTFTSQSGIRLAIRPSYPEDRVLASPSARVGKLKGHGSLWPLDGADHEGEDLDPLSLRAGTGVLAEVTVRPDCKKVEFSPRIEFSVTARHRGGKNVVDTFVPSNPEAYEPAIRLWCKVGVALQAGGGSGGSDRDGGEARVALLISNASAQAIAVEMPPLSDGGATWSPLSASVPAGQELTRIVEGSGVRCASDQQVPWSDGRILVNGKPLGVSVADAWC
jgi:hypothetical protein